MLHCCKVVARLAAAFVEFRPFSERRQRQLRKKNSLEWRSFEFSLLTRMLVSLHRVHLAGCYLFAHIIRTTRDTPHARDNKYHCENPPHSTHMTSKTHIPHVYAPRTHSVRMTLRRISQRRRQELLARRSPAMLRCCCCAASDASENSYVM